MDDQQIAAIEARSDRARSALRPVAGQMVWTLDQARALWESAQDVPELIAEIRRVRKTVDILWYTLNRDQKPIADDALADAGLPEVERGYRG